METIYFFLFRYGKYILLLICILLVKSANQFVSSKPVKYVKRFDGRKISYDRKFKKKQLKLSIRLTLLYLVCIIVEFLLLLIDGLEWIGLIMLQLQNVVLLLVVINWLVYIDCLCYLRRLKKWGYEVPEDKSKYVHLERLPKVEGDFLKSPEVSRESVALAVLNWLAAVFTIIGGIGFATEHAVVQDIVNLCMVVIGMILIVWVLCGIFYWRQRQYIRYRDDVEFDNDRKKRVHLAAGLGVLVGVAIAAGAVFMVMDLGADYIEAAREEAGYY